MGGGAPSPAGMALTPSQPPTLLPAQTVVKHKSSHLSIPGHSPVPFPNDDI